MKPYTSYNTPNISTEVGTAPTQYADANGRPKPRRKPRPREAARKRRQKLRTRAFVQAYKEHLYLERTGDWLPHYLLDWHHLDPSEKYKSVSKLYNRSIPRALEEVNKCIPVSIWEHQELH